MTHLLALPKEFSAELYQPAQPKGASPKRSKMKKRHGKEPLPEKDDLNIKIAFL